MVPSSRSTSTSTVGLPRESRISRAPTASMIAMPVRLSAVLGAPAQHPRGARPSPTGGPGRPWRRDQPADAKCRALAQTPDTPPAPPTASYATTGAEVLTRRAGATRRDCTVASTRDRLSGPRVSAESASMAARWAARASGVRRRGGPARGRRLRRFGLGDEGEQAVTEVARRSPRPAGRSTRRAPARAPWWRAAAPAAPARCRRTASAPAFSSALIPCHCSVDLGGRQSSSARSSPKTWGLRRCIFSLMPRATSSMVNAPDSSAITAWK